MVVKRILFAGSLAALMVLTGCPSHQGANARLSKRANAPTLAGGGRAGSPGATAGQNAGAPEGAAEDAAAEKEHRDEELIASVEKAYHEGLSNYQQSNYQAARANFNYAVDLMLRCNCDIRKDPRLSSEFNRIVDAENTLEMDAMREGSGPQQETEPSPVDIAGNLTTTASASATAKTEAELKTTRSDLPLKLNPFASSVVANYIDFFTNNPRGHATIVASLERLGRYKKMIQGVLKENHLPQDLIYQAVAESGFRPGVVNPRSGAAGMWQFMPWGTYGLVHNAWEDQRFDPVDSTEAYAREIKKMYNQLGDWYLAMAAYDWGPGNVQRAVERTGYASFWQLYRRNNLPVETKNYVPIILAVTIMAKNPSQYGLADLKPDPPLEMDTVKTDYAVSLQLVADIVGVPVSQIETLNPALLRMCTPPDDPYSLHLPKGSASTFEQDIAQIPKDKRLYWRLDSVTDGETLAQVAQKWHVPLSDLAMVNQLQTTASLDGVDKLIIPLPPRGEPRMLRGGLYRIRNGDTLIAIADRFGVSVEELERWNHLRGTFLRAGQALYIAEPARIRDFRRRLAMRQHDGLYRVQNGDTLGGIASHFRVTVAELRQWNHLRGNAIDAGHTLRVARPGRREADPPRARSSHATHHARRARVRYYRVRRGDTLGGIAARFGVSVTDLRRWNHLRGNEIRIGHTLRVAR